MTKNTFAIFGILAVLLMSLGMVSAGVEGLELTIEGPGSYAGDRWVGDNISTGTFSVIVDYTNTTLGDIYVNWTNSAMTMPASNGQAFFSGNTSGVVVSGFILDMPYNFPSTKRITAHIYNNSNRDMKYDTQTVAIYYNNTDYVAATVDPIRGCIDSNYDNYNPLATEDDGSCANDTPTPQTGDAWCEDFSGETGDLEITSIDITNNGQGDDDKWQYLDDIEIEIVIENTDRYDSLDDVIVEIEIRDDNGNTYDKRDFNLNDDNEDVGRVKKDGGEEIIIFTIDEVSIDLEEGDYKLYVRAYEDNNEDNQCASTSDDLENNDDDETYFEFEVEAGDDSAIIVKNKLQLDTILASCGDKNVEVKFNVYNTGDDKEDKILVNLYDPKLGIDEYAVVDNLKDGKSKEVTFFIDVPEDFEGTTAELDIIIFYDYDEDEDELEIFAYEENSNSEGSDFSIGLNIVSCAGPSPSIEATLDSETQIGTNLVVKALVTNNGNDNDFDFSISDFESWAELVSVTPQTDSLNKGESTELTIIFNPKETGAHSFKINAIVDGEPHDQAVSVNIDEKKGFFSDMSDTVTYAIIGIIAVLVLIFLVLIAKFSRRSAKPQF